jgi:hypothetical protein
MRRRAFRPSFQSLDSRITPSDLLGSLPEQVEPMRPEDFADWLVPDGVPAERGPQILTAPDGSVAVTQLLDPAAVTA